jgi:sterol desaturase/sphingolipid hydroxylase (fatty acid hydroxylase superfamily)
MGSNEDPIAMPAHFNDIARIWLLNIAIVLPAYAAFAFGVWLVLWVLLRRPLASRKIREDAPPNRQLITEFLYSVRSVAIFATISVAGAFLIRGGFYPLSDLAGHWGPIWFWASLALMIVGQDAYIYWIHRWMHRSRWYRRLHRRHHLSRNPSPFSAYSFNIGEALLMTAFPFLWPLLIPTPWATSLLFLIHQIFRNTLLHAGYELMPARADGRPWLDWMTTTTHHDLHHAQPRYNFASWFTWWDRWMKTEHPEYRLRFAGAARIVARPHAAPSAPDA